MSNNNDFPAGASSKTVAVVVPMHNRIELTTEEEISLRHLVHFLGKYDKYMVVPKSLPFDYPGFGIMRFSDKYFGSTRAHIKLILCPKFYEAFIDYKYILMYQLDCLVFSGDLIQWCNLDLDYIGAPWIKHENTPYAGNSVYEGKVGNGGFSLRKTESFLNVLYSQRYQIEPKRYWEAFYGQKSTYIQCINLPKKFLKHLRAFNSVKWEVLRWSNSADRFVAERATHYYPKFKISPVDTALSFAFECVPRYCFELNNYKLPFGCHAWPRYDREFWEPYLLK